MLGIAHDLARRAAETYEVCCGTNAQLGVEVPAGWAEPAQAPRVFNGVGVVDGGGSARKTLMVRSRGSRVVADIGSRERT